jgi:hypothetical protein
MDHVLERKNRKRRFFLSKSMPNSDFAKLLFSGRRTAGKDARIVRGLPFRGKNGRNPRAPTPCDLEIGKCDGQDHIIRAFLSGLSGIAAAVRGRIVLQFNRSI